MKRRRTVHIYDEVGYQCESCFNALVRMFEHALMIATTLPASRDALVARLHRVRSINACPLVCDHIHQSEY